MIFIIILTITMTLFFYLKRHDIIICMYPMHTIEKDTNTQTKKSVSLYYWKQDRWNRENVEIVWLASVEDRIKTLINSLLTVLEEENLITKKASVQSVSLNQKATYAYVSFDRSFLNKEHSTNSKLMLIESLLKTLRENDISLNYVQFLVRHEPMNDQHLDLSYPWPLHGFYNHSQEYIR